ncbi:MAG: glycogen debranching protein GlgX [Alphaproteobacteria bacterium]|jgi:glycogen operon protein|nr:glycogen debranching protein GlgX [Alphaproteobacteria bacterium]
MELSKGAVLPGRPYPLGATWDGEGVNFALFSAHAEKVELCLFDVTGQIEVRRVALPERTDQVWHGYMADVRPGVLYGYRVYGPYDPVRGHRFNPNKLLLDPYAREIVGEIAWSEAHKGYEGNSHRQDLSFDGQDSAPVMPKGRVVASTFDWGDDTPPRVPWQDTIVYEAHVRGLTMLHPDIPAHERGTFLAVASEPVIAYLTRLGVTAIELMPVHAFVDDKFLVDRSLRNYWGYSTLGFFAPEQRYLGKSEGGVEEFKTMVKRLHAAGIEVILDVVYNHTCEGEEVGPTLSFRGIDNASYYRLDPGNPRYYLNETGCGNALNLSHPRVLQMVMDSLRYWVTEMHVDGFRFDLATTLGREVQGFDTGSGFFDAVRQDPVLATVKLIAEPWDIGPGGYRLGQFPGGWAEWNDRYRDTVRRFWRGDHGMLPELARALSGSADLFEHNGRRPWCGINFAACHDGFTLFDTVAYNTKHNEANKEGGRDGHNDNCSDNYGHEGLTDDVHIDSIRVRQISNMLATILFSQGTPMIWAGDEFGRTQNGNNNAYCQDNEVGWVDWRLRSPRYADLQTLTARMIAFRRAQPVLRRGRHLHGVVKAPDGTPDISWYSPHGAPVTMEQWQDFYARCLGVLLAGDAGSELQPDGTPVEADSLFLIFNAHIGDVPFRIPRLSTGRRWSLEIDTAKVDREPGSSVAEFEEVVPVDARSVRVYRLVRES